MNNNSQTDTNAKAEEAKEQAEDAQKQLDDQEQQDEADAIKDHPENASVGEIITGAYKQD